MWAERCRARRALEQKAPEEEDAQNDEDGDDDDFNQAHCRFLGAKNWTGGILTTVEGSVNALICKELLIHLFGNTSIKMAGAKVC